jgi:hypothetical protein
VARLSTRPTTASPGVHLPGPTPSDNESWSFTEGSSRWAIPEGLRTPAMTRARSFPSSRRPSDSATADTNGGRIIVSMKRVETTAIKLSIREPAGDPIPSRTAGGTEPTNFPVATMNATDRPARVSTRTATAAVSGLSTPGSSPIVLMLPPKTGDTRRFQSPGRAPSDMLHIRSSGKSIPQVYGSIRAIQ